MTNRAILTHLIIITHGRKALVLELKCKISALGAVDILNKFIMSKSFSELFKTFNDVEYMEYPFRTYECLLWLPELEEALSARYDVSSDFKILLELTNKEIIKRHHPDIFAKSRRNFFNFFRK